VEVSAQMTYQRRELKPNCRCSFLQAVACYHQRHKKIMLSPVKDVDG
jgi:hypothetical protein